MSLGKSVFFRGIILYNIPGADKKYAKIEKLVFKAFKQEIKSYVYLLYVNIPLIIYTQKLSQFEKGE